MNSNTLPDSFIIERKTQYREAYQKLIQSVVDTEKRALKAIGEGDWVAYEAYMKDADQKMKAKKNMEFYETNLFK